MPELSGQTLIVKQLSDCQRKLGIIPGAYVPAGGTAGQVLIKLSAANYDTGWSNILGSLVLAGNGIVFSGGNTIHFAQSAAYTAGAIPFATGAAAMGFDAANLYWDNTNKRLGVNTNAPTGPITVGTQWADLLNHDAVRAYVFNTAPGNTASYHVAGSFVFETLGANNYTLATESVVALEGQARHNGSGTCAALTGTRGYAAKVTTGPVTNCYGGRFRVFNYDAVGAINYGFGLYVQTPTITGVIDNYYGLYIEAGAGTATYGIFQAGTGDLNSLLGKSGLGIAGSATSWATFAASTATITSLRVTAGTAAYAGTVEGDFWNDYTQKCLIGYIDGLKQFDSRVSFVMTADKTVTNTNAETTLFAAGIGTLTFPANFFVVGKSVRITLRGHHTMDATPPTLTFRVKLGGVTFASVVYSDLNDTNQYLEVSFLLTCRTTGAGGTGIGQGIVLMHESTGGSASADMEQLVMTATAAMNTTGSLALDVTVQPSAADAGSTLTITNGVVEVIA